MKNYDDDEKFLLSVEILTLHEFLRKPGRSYEPHINPKKENVLYESTK